MINRELKVGDKIRCIVSDIPLLDLNDEVEVVKSPFKNQIIILEKGGNTLHWLINMFPYKDFELIEESHDQSSEQTIFHQENILTKANDIRKGSRQSDYGDAVENFKKIAQIASIRSNKEITPLDCVNVLMSVKDVRESFKHKEDNLIDLAGYADIKNLIMESEK